MIRLSPRTELIYPVRTMLFYGAQVIVYLGIVTALGWGWGQLRFSPVQRYYFEAYAEASVGVATGSGPNHVKWIEKRAANRPWQIADPEDLVPASRGGAPFALSPSASSQGWTELGYDNGGSNPELKIRDILQAYVFSGYSLPVLILQPFAFFFAGWMCWKFFDHWRKGEARNRGAGWDPEYRPNTLFQDLGLFSRQASRKVKRLQELVASWRKLRAEAMPSVTASPLGMAQDAMEISEKPSVPVAVPFANPVPIQQSRPAAPPTPPRPSKVSKSQPVQVQSEPKPVVISPFGKPVPEGQAEAKWDISKWIE